MLALVQREVVDKYHWLDEKEFLNMMALAQAAPGLIAVNSAIFLGHRLCGWRGVAACVAGAHSSRSSGTHRRYRGQAR